MHDDGSWFNYSGGRPGSAMRRGSIQWYWHRFGRTGLFRSADLNLVGWAVVVGPGIVLGLALAVALNWPWQATIPGGVVCSWLAALALDSVAWRRLTTGIDVSDLTLSQIDAVLARLHKQGVDVSLEEDVEAGTDEIGLSFQSTNRFLKPIRREVEAERRTADGDD